jgi:hypothetical protein
MQTVNMENTLYLCNLTQPAQLWPIRSMLFWKPKNQNCPSNKRSLVTLTTAKFINMTYFETRNIRMCVFICYRPSCFECRFCLLSSDRPLALKSERLPTEWRVRVWFSERFAVDASVGHVCQVQAWSWRPKCSGQ